MPKSREADGDEDVRMRFVFYLHRQKHDRLCAFLSSMPPGMVSHHIREALEQYAQLSGLASASEPERRSAPPRTKRERKPTNAEGAERSAASVTVTQPHPPQPFAKPATARPAPTFGAPPASAMVTTAAPPVMLAPTQPVQPSPAPEPASAPVTTAEPRSEAGNTPRSLDHVPSLIHLADTEDTSLIELLSNF